MHVLRARGLVTCLVTAAMGALPALALTTTASPAAAAVNDPVLSGATSSMWQTNNNVEALQVSNGVVYAGGTFTRVRPAGAAAGSQEVTRNYLAAFSASTGNLVTSFNVTLNGRVEDLAVSPDGTRLYIAGAFTTVNGTTKNRVAAINIPSGTLVTGFTANANKVATAIDATSSAVYVAGDFDTMNGTSRTRLASVNATTGALNTAFTANLDARALAIEAAPDGSRILVGGQFTTVDGTRTGGMVSVNPTSGDLASWNANSSQSINLLCAGRVTDIVAQGSNAYVTAEGDPPGCYEGTYAARISDGAMSWNSSCLGAALGLAVMDNVLYKASHQHDCAFNTGDARGGFVGALSRDGFIWQRLVAQNVSDGSFIHWAPNTNSGTGSNPVGPHVLATDGTQMFVGGDFTKVNTVGQQGLARFGRTSNATPNRPAAPSVQSTRSGQATVTWPAVYDPDDGTLTYQLYRGSTLIYSTSKESYPWSRPVMRYDDTGRTTGSTQSYYLKVTDGTATSAASPSTSVVIRSTNPGSYASTVQALNPSFYWDMSGSGTTVPDQSGQGRSAALVGGAARSTGALGATNGVSLDGSDDYVTSSSAVPLTASYTQSLWVKGTTVRGGSLMAITDVRTGDSPTGYADRMLSMDNNGNVVWAVRKPTGGGEFGPPLNPVRLQGPIYNDGRWHHVVGSWDNASGTAALYIDGVLNGTFVGTAAGASQGYYRVGYADLSQNQAVFGINFYNLFWPGSEHFNGGVDEVSVFPTALSATQVQNLFAAGVNQGG